MFRKTLQKTQNIYRNRPKITQAALRWIFSPTNSDCESNCCCACKGCVSFQDCRQPLTRVCVGGGITCFPKWGLFTWSYCHGCTSNQLNCNHADSHNAPGTLSFSLTLDNKATRYGVCSNWLDSIAEGAVVPVFIRK